MRIEWDTAKKSAGFTVWTPANILPWSAWLRSEWRDLIYSGAGVPSLTTAWQERIIWERIIEDSPAGRELLRIDSAAALAEDAWTLAHAWRLPLDSPLFEGSDDTAAFRSWVRLFAAEVKRLDAIDAARLPELLVRHAGAVPRETVLYGFDEITPQQSALAAACSLGRIETDTRAFGRAIRTSLPDESAEIEAAAHWARAILEKQPNARIGIAAPRIEWQLPAIERTLRDVLHPSGSANPAFHIALGPPLDSRPAIHTALLLLESVQPRVPIAAFSSILLSPWIGGGVDERSARAQFDARLRRDRIGESALDGFASRPYCPLRLLTLLQGASRVIAEFPQRQSPSGWSRSLSKLLASFEWPGERGLSSSEHQTVEAFRALLSELAALDAVVPSFTVTEAAGLVRRICGASRFEPEDLGQPVQVTGFLEAAQDSFDHLWILGLDDETWPPAASANPFLPLELQRTPGLPHATAERQLEWSRAITGKLLSAAPDIVASHARLSGERELSPSPLIAHLPFEEHAGVPRRWYLHAAPLEDLLDAVAPPLDEATMQSGGTRALKLQAACGFRAFAEIRLKARELDAPPLGLDHLTRGNLLHKALHYFWSEMQSRAALSAAEAATVRDCVARSVSRAIAEEKGPPETLFEARLQAVERRRLMSLLESWLEVELERPLPFAVVEGERDREIAIGGLTLRARIDRIDRLNDGRLVVIDYKSTAPSLAAWMGDRPDEPQVPLYATALDAPIAAVAFAQVQTGDSFFRAIGSEPAALQNLDSEDMEARIEAWRATLTRLASDFRAGRAPVDPKDPSSCQYCGLHSLCRIDEKQ